MPRHRRNDRFHGIQKQNGQRLAKNFRWANSWIFMLHEPLRHRQGQLKGQKMRGYFVFFRTNASWMKKRCIFAVVTTSFIDKIHGHIQHLYIRNTRGRQKSALQRHGPESHRQGSRHRLSPSESGGGALLTKRTTGCSPRLSSSP